VFYDNVFEKDWKMLELRALCFLPDQLLFTPALLRIKLSNLDNTHYIRFTWRIIKAKTNSCHYIYFQYRLTPDHTGQLQFLSNLTLRRRVPLHTDFLPLPFTRCVTRKLHAIFAASAVGLPTTLRDEQFRVQIITRSRSHPTPMSTEVISGNKAARAWRPLTSL
jgi:hypothetical protein